MQGWVRFSHAGEKGFGLLAQGGDRVAVHTGEMFDRPQPSGRTLNMAEIELLAPVRPRKFIGLWNNFYEFATKLGAEIPTVPLYFLKSPDCIVASDALVQAPRSYAGRTFYEGELGIVIGGTCTDMDEAGAESAIFGYTIVNDLTALDLLTENPAFPQWARAKSCDGYGPVGPCIVTDFDWKKTLG